MWDRMRRVSTTVSLGRKGWASTALRGVCGGLLLLFASKITAAQVGPSPIDVSAIETKSLGLVKIVLKPKYHADVKVASEGLLSRIAKNFSAHGYHVVGAADEQSMFESADVTDADMLVGGTIMHLECEDSKYYKSLGTCEIGVNWELFDNRRHQVVYTVTSRFRREVSYRNEHIETEVHALIYGAVRSLLARQRFVELMKGKATVQKSAGSAYAPAQFQRCDISQLSLPAEMSKAMDASVIVKHGDVVGSGFYISNDGLVLTAAHVVQGVNTAIVKDLAGAERQAVVVRRNRKLDTALIKVDGAKTPCIPLLESAPVVGSDIYAIGSPGGEKLSFSVSRGVVSGIRDWEGEQYIQTDASINAGNSGGPLLTTEGGVIGIASWKIVIPGFEGLSFAVPIMEGMNALNIRAGNETSASLQQAVSETDSQAAAATAGMTDTPDPEYAQLAVESSTFEKKIIMGARQRRLYHPARYVLMLSGPLSIVAGGVMVLGSTASYSSKTGGFLSTEEEPIVESDFRRLKIINTVGWGLMGLGVGLSVLYFATPQSRERYERKLREQGVLTKQNHRNVQMGLRVGYGSLQLDGTF